MKSILTNLSFGNVVNNLAGIILIVAAEQMPKNINPTQNRKRL